jgi:chemotaxis protein CheD
MATDLKIADLVVTRSREPICVYGLGSCIAVILRDSDAGVTGACHILLPSAPDGKPPGKPAKYADKAIDTMIKEMKNLGARKGKITARIVGGAHMFSFPSPKEGLPTIGERNVSRARQLLHALRIPIVSEDTGGDYGRTVEIDTTSGEVRITTVHHGEKTI